MPLGHLRAGGKKSKGEQKLKGRVTKGVGVGRG